MSRTGRRQEGRQGDGRKRPWATGSRAFELAGLAAVGGRRRLVRLALLAPAGRLDRLDLRTVASRAMGTGAPRRCLRVKSHLPCEPSERTNRVRRSVRIWRRPLACVPAVVARRREYPADGRAGQGAAREHMPELVPTWQRLTALLGDDPEAAAALTLWNPPPFLTGCSQAAVLPGGPALVRNYDWDFRLFDAVVARTAYVGRAGARHARLPVGAARRSQRRWPGRLAHVRRQAARRRGLRHTAGDPLRAPDVPDHRGGHAGPAPYPGPLSYNVTALDRAGLRATAYLAPDRPAHVTGLAVATNHQGKVEWAPYAAAIRTVERQQHLEELLTAGRGRSGHRGGLLALPAVRHALSPGLRHPVYRRVPARRGIARYHWPDQTWNTHWTGSGPAAPRSSSAGPSRAFPAQRWG